MAAASDVTSAQATLRAITYRLSSTPPKQIPHVAAQLACNLWACKDLISSPPAPTKQGNEGSVTINRFRTYLSSLLQDRTIEGRWAGVVLVKATIEAGGVEVLSKTNAWVRSLLGILKKPDPPTTRILAVITLTRIFTLTWEYTNLIREIATPALPAFIEKWDEALKVTITAAHTTCDRIFRSVIEDWQSTSGVQPSLAVNALLQGEAEMEGDDALGMSGWKGVYAGSERLVALLDLLSSQMVTATAGAVTVRLGLIVDLLTRLFSLRTPLGKQITVKPNQQVSRDEREVIFALLPGVHIAALTLTRSILHRFGPIAASLTQPLLAQITWLFQAEAEDSDVRTATYGALADVLELQGPSLSRGDVADVESIVKACCRDLLPSDQIGSMGKGVAPALSSQNGVLGLQATNITSSNVPAQLRLAAEALLPLCFSQIASTHIPGRLRTLTERTAILTQHKDALVASVLNAAPNGSRTKTQPSLLPLLAKQYPHSAEVEALLRPRMPVIKTGRSGAGDEGNEDEEEYGDVPSPFANGHEEATDGARDDDMPSSGLLDTGRDSHETAHAEDVYSASPRRPAEAAGSEAAHDKRKITDSDVNTEHSAKRVRASPVAEAEPSLPNTAGTPTAPDRLAAQSGLPVPVSQDRPSSSFVTAPEPSQQAAAAPAPVSSRAKAVVASYNAGDMVDIGSEGSDFEMPPLTMEQDTEDEDEDEEDDKEEGGQGE
ncbi:hypothetical protein B0A55_05211 [Friedmanniomyces simplex]|uniref:Pre-rRNA-processing protein RIX1 n=1 Tax=Friedmanniomyces simplex TaxID=329884 RepID=A0A4U0XA91_9PEZI|nr:hypothetical protein B0A55_05211 [Friedmanniomyces simplex]